MGSAPRASRPSTAALFCRLSWPARAALFLKPSYEIKLWLTAVLLHNRHMRMCMPLTRHLHTERPKVQPSRDADVDEACGTKTKMRDTFRCSRTPDRWWLRGAWAAADRTNLATLGGAGRACIAHRQTKRWSALDGVRCSGHTSECAGDACGCIGHSELSHNVRQAAPLRLPAGRPADWIEPLLVDGGIHGGALHLEEELRASIYPPHAFGS